MNSNLRIIEHNKCRLCKSYNLEYIYNFGNLYISNYFNKEDLDKGFKSPLELVGCLNCSLVQLKHTAPYELLYSDYYWYRSGVTNTMKNILKHISVEAHSMTELIRGDVILDIGANDGTLLKYFNTENNDYIRVGCEPAKNLKDELTTNCEIVINDYWDFDKFHFLVIEKGMPKAKIITAIGMFYDLEDPMKFIADIKLSLHENGIFIAQLMCLESMLEKNDLGNICHEHLEYYTYKSLIYLFEKNGLEIVKIEKNEVNGGSYKLFIKHYRNGSINYKENFNTSSILEFINRINQSKTECVDFINQETSKGKKIYVYGASTKGNTILQYYGITNKHIKFAAERSPDKYNKFTVGSNIEIISEEQARKDSPDYFLILPWSFVDEFIIREKEWISRGGKFIIPLPEFRIYPSND